MRKFALVSAAIASMSLAGCIVAEPVAVRAPPSAYYEPPPAYYYYAPPPRYYGPSFGFGLNYGYGRGGYHGHRRW